MPAQPTNYSMMDKCDMSLQNRMAAFQTVNEDEHEGKIYNKPFPWSSTAIKTWNITFRSSSLVISDESTEKP